MLIMCDGGFFPGLKVSEASERQFMEAYVRERIPLTRWWMDAGWYVCDEWPQIGTWEIDTSRFPNGIKAVSDLAHAHGMQLILWFEPERVTAGSWLQQNHPEWLLGDTLLDLGNPDARTWLTDHVDRLISEQGIDLYRQDFNMDYPLTPYSLDDDAWIAWQFHRPETGEGFVQAFRRSQCATNRRVLRLHGLDPAASYLCTDLDGEPDRVLTGSELAVEITSQPGSALIRYAPVS